MRGMQTKQTAQKIMDAIMLHYNFLRVHSTIKKTPAEKAGIQIDLDGNRVEQLIRMSQIRPRQNSI